MDDCKGCKSFRFNTPFGLCCSASSVQHLSKTESCPCITCLIKGMCGRACEEFQIYKAKTARIKNGQRL